ncbi:PhoX family phosphatase [Roseomonas sp. CCTCC AB2023176]|uniref:PhoX family protein n=1 Tax=Roseomonas sp. CCTCC AB2023176 TaxID=3342640 RepID=UPI0035D8270B
MTDYASDDAAAPVEIEDIGSNPRPQDPIGEVIGRRMARRAALRGLFGVAAGAALTDGMVGRALAQTTSAPAATEADSTLTFAGLPPATDGREAVAEGYEVQTVIRWGDPILPGAPAFDPANVTAEAQSGQFGYNNDYVDFFALPKGAPAATEHGLLVVNHEYTNTNLIFAGVGEGTASRLRTNREQAMAEIQAHGMSVVEIKRENGRWSYVPGSPHNRRITGTTPIRISGPAAGHERLKTSADPTGTQVLGTFNNCAGGNTPWGTVITCEENFNQYFGGAAAESGPQAESYKRLGIVPNATYAWGRFEQRFNLDQEPNEPNRFGWVVEFDPYDPSSVPVKRTALGRFKHEGCTHAVSADGRVVFYMGDDERNDYVYKFVTARPYDAANPAANRDLLDDGTLYVARFHDDGRVEWLPLTHGQGPLTEANGFRSQGDVVIEARRAADLLGATPMDRPEDVETNPATGRVFVILTNNNRRTPDKINAANPRANNTQGHVLEIIPPQSGSGGAGAGRVDHAATTARWELFLVAGRPGTHAGAAYHRAVGAEGGWLSCPDNCAFDSKGRIWIATDGAPEAARIQDGLYAADTQGAGRALTKRFYSAPQGAEVCGPLIGPGERTVFLAIQHPGEDRGSTFENPSTRWPDNQSGVPPRPSVIAIVRRDGGVVGS